MKITKKFNNKNQFNTLMIHSFQSRFYPGDDTSVWIDNILDQKDPSKLSEDFLNELKERNIKRITFDDGLYQQIPIIKLFKKHFDEVYFFPTGHFIRDEETEPQIMENSKAHRIYHETKLHPSTFMSSTEVWDLLFEGSRFGIHGWYHYNLNPNILPKQIGSDKFKQKMLALKIDAAASVNYYINLISTNPSLFIKDGHLIINYCTPYNCLNGYQDIYIDMLIALFTEELKPNILNLNITEVTIEIFSNERISIEGIIQGEKNATF